MKTIIIRTLIPLLAIAVAYASIAFITFDLNPGNWALDSRYAMVVLVVILGGAGGAMYELSRGPRASP